MQRITELTVSEFTRQLAAEQPTPGGGSAAALAGALGAGLVCMVCAYTIGRERHRDVDRAARRVLARAHNQRERAARPAAMQEALRESANVPPAVAAGAGELVGLAHVAAEIANETLISDAAVAASLAFAALQSVCVHVELNAAGITDQAFREAARERLALAGRAEDLELIVRCTHRLAARTP